MCKNKLHGTDRQRWAYPHTHAKLGLIQKQYIIEIQSCHDGGGVGLNLKNISLKV